MDKLLVILGPTATGKTDLALRLASLAQGELVSVDSRQVYKGLDIGTGKMPSGKVKVKRGERFWEINGIKIWMYDVVDPKRQYTVADYVKDAREVVGDIRGRGKLPIIVGGTGFYLKALLEGLPSLSIPVDQKLRKELEELSLNQLQKNLQEVSPQKWEKMNNSDRQNPRRLVRAIEIVILSETKDLKIKKLKPRDSSLIVQNDKKETQNDSLKIGLTAPRQILYQRIDERVVSRIKQGMIDEAKKLHKEGLTFKRMRQLGLEYGVLADYLSGRIRGIKGDQGLVKIMQGKIHGFARRQLTWFKSPSTLRPRSGRTSSGYIYWFDITDKHFPNNVEKVITKWYYQTADVTKD